MEDSTLCGVSFANNTIAGSLVKASTSILVTVSVKITKTNGLKPNVIFFTYINVVMAPKKLVIDAITIIVRIGKSFRKPLYTNIEKNKQTEPSTESMLKVNLLK